MRLVLSILRMMSRPRDAIAAIDLADAIIDEAVDLAELRTRMARKAMSGDLDDSLARLLELRR